ncbi:MAG: alpha/beta hydrolase, partial [Hydrogenophaga sp.]|nr:alpha/beta hydrolase [Hydrogenophaga sp.]
MKRLIALLLATLALLAGCATLDEKQRAWIFQPSDRSWAGGTYAAESM